MTFDKSKSIQIEQSQKVNLNDNDTPFQASNTRRVNNISRAKKLKIDKNILTKLCQYNIIIIGDL